MKNILKDIVAAKKAEVAARKLILPAKKMETSSRTCISLRDALMYQGSSGIIAEFKRKSPSERNGSSAPSKRSCLKKGFGCVNCRSSL